MRGVITKQLAETLVLNPYGKKYSLSLVGSLAKIGRSYNDMDILISYLKDSDPLEFTKDLENDGWSVLPHSLVGNYPAYKRFTKRVGQYDITIDLYKQQYVSKNVSIQS